MYHQRTRLRTGVVVTAVHPVLGRLYWYFSDETSVNGGHYYNFTNRLSEAVLLDRDWRSIRYPSHQYHAKWAVRQLEEEEDALWERSGQTMEDFHAWLIAADWQDMPAPARAEKLVDLGYSSEWESYTPDLQIEFAANFDAFAVALSARLNWMHFNCLRGIGLDYRAEGAKIKVAVALNKLAQHEAVQGVRYRSNTPTVLSDVPELVLDYQDMYAYWAGRVADQQAEGQL